MAVKKETVATTDTNTEVKETKPKTTKTTTKVAKVEEVAPSAEMLKAIMEQMEAMKAEIELAKSEKSSMSELVDALRGNTNETKGLPTRVKIISLVHNTLVLSTKPNGGGTPYVFKKFGDSVTMRTTELEDILSIQGYRRQAEEPLFYIADSTVAEDQGLSDIYETVNKDKVEYITSLCDDMCVDLFCGLGEKLQESIVCKIVEDMAKNGVKYDRNRLGDIKTRTGVDIESKVDDMKRTLEVIAKRNQV